MCEPTNNTAEAKRLVAALAPHAGRMNLLDQRYVETWQLYLNRCGDQAQVNERRLTWLRKLANEYLTTSARQASVQQTEAA